MDQQSEPGVLKNDTIVPSLFNAQTTITSLADLVKPYLEHIAEPKDSSWVLFDRQLKSIPFKWHYNVEYELTLTLNSRGQRFVGNSVFSYDHGDLVLIGPKIPHTWCSSHDVQTGQKHQALVLWFTDSFVKGIIEPHIEFHPTEAPR